MPGIFKHVFEIRALEKELLRTEDKNKKNIKSKIKDLRVPCITDYQDYASEECRLTRVKDVNTGREYLDEVIILYQEGYKYQRTYSSKDLKRLLKIYLIQIEAEIEAMLDLKYARVIEGEKGAILFAKESLRKLSNYRKEAFKLSAIGQEDLEGETSDLKIIEKDILRFEAYGYFVRGNLGKALEKYDSLLKDVRFQEKEWLLDLHFDVGDLLESTGDYKFALRSYEKAGSYLVPNHSRSRIEDVNKKINELLKNLENSLKV